MGHCNCTAKVSIFSTPSDSNTLNGYSVLIPYSRGPKFEKVGLTKIVLYKFSSDSLGKKESEKTWVGDLD